MAIFRTETDGASLFYRYYIPSSTPHRPAATIAQQPLTLVFLHGWPMSSRMFDQLIVPLVETHRFPVIAPDRRGFGNSDWTTPTTGEVTFETFVRDAVALLENVMKPNPGPFVFVAASMGSVESVLARAASGFLREHCKGFVWLGPNMPCPVSCEESPGAPGPEVWDGLIQGLRGPAAKDFIAQSVPGLFRNDLGNQVSQDAMQFFERLILEADPVAVERTAVILQRSMIEELKEWAAAGAADERERLGVLILHGDSDTGMPVEASSALIHKILPWSQLKVYENAGHGIYLTHAQQVLDDILAFLQPIISQQQL
ncbi:Alpha/Beta hydrolase protein [Chaetomium fimeti]|uniref:Alpha/Beta hydrolase protein n=1 Tax=Chaetomium fimeti TaxID=1854472 RepID=A0AAE0LT74_9PEZI|nr:Alpha/Beta hydrolase protein [Chaetomium fimeti]